MVRESFDATGRRLEDYARRLRGNVKAHRGGAPLIFRFAPDQRRPIARTQTKERQSARAPSPDPPTLRNHDDRIESAIRIHHGLLGGGMVTPFSVHEQTVTVFASRQLQFH